MQNEGKLIGQCSNGHDVYVINDINGEIDGGTIGADVVEPFPDNCGDDPIIVACPECVKKVHEHLMQKK